MADSNANLTQAPAGFREAYELVLPEIEALEESDLMAINIDVPTAVTTVLGAWPEILAYRDRIAAGVPALDMEQFDKLETYALAASHAHATYLTPSGPNGSRELVESAFTARTLLLGDAQALVARGLIGRERLKELKGGPSHRNLAFDLLALSAMIRELWDEVQGHIGTKLEELDEAERRARQLLSIVGQREQAPQVAGAQADKRQRAFTLLVRAYDQVRRALTFLRWKEDDIDQIAPSLYAGRGRRPTPRTDVPSVPPAATSPGTTPAAQPEVHQANGSNGVHMPVQAVNPIVA